MGETDQALPKIMSKDKEMINIESKLKVEETNELALPSLDNKRQKVKKKTIEKRDDSVHVESRDTLEHTDDFKHEESKGVKIKPKPSEIRESSVDVENRQHLETL